MTKIILIAHIFAILTAQNLKKNVNVTFYDMDGPTASGIRTINIDEPFVAVSRDLLKIYPMNSYIKISNCRWSGSYKVMDKMGRKVKNTVDIFSIEKPIEGRLKLKCTCEKLIDEPQK
jgi:3D (Asp-Asp-Asp) domain-containing protein